MVILLERGTGQARIQRSQPMHISISNCTSFGLNGCRSLRCIGRASLWAGAGFTPVPVPTAINGFCEGFAAYVVILTSKAMYYNWRKSVLQVRWQYHSVSR